MIRRLILVTALLARTCFAAVAQTALTSSFVHGGTAEWRMQRDGDVHAAAAAVATVGFDDSAWLPAVVPGTVLTSLVANKVVPEPYYGTNNRIADRRIPDIATAGREFYTYWYRTEITIPANFAGRTVWLEPQGVNYRAEVWVNGHLLTMLSGMFQSASLDITDLVRPGAKAAIALRIFPVDEPGTAQPKSWGAVGEWRNGGNGAIGANVTQLMTVGWDFTFEDGIRDRNTGPWRDIILRATGPVALRDAFIRSDLNAPQFDVARESVSVDLVNPKTSAQGHIILRGEITPVSMPSASPQGSLPTTPIRFERELSLQRGERRTVTFTPDDFPQLVIHQPQLWWPKNKGPQPLYRLTFTATVDGHTSDSLTTHFGIRHVATTRQTPDGSKLFLVNGRPIFVRGSNWIPEAMLRTDDRRIATELAYTAQSGVNLLRLWGGGVAESDRFYELCDSLGIMVWQEFWMTGDTRHPADEDLYLQNMAATVRRIRNHPSIVFYVSSNESTEVGGAPELLHELDGTRPYQMQSECDGVHDGSPYKQVNPMCHYENTASDRGSRVDGFNPEYGAPSLPIYESLRHMMPEADLWPINKSTWDYLDGGGFHLMSSLYTELTDQYGTSTNIRDFARRGQLVAAMNAKSIWEVWNRNKLDSGERFCSGLLFWYHNCPNVQVCARMWDWYLEPTAALYHTMHALEPLHVQYDYLTNRVSVVNDNPEAYTNLTVTATVYDLNSRRISRQQISTAVDADGVADSLLTITFPEDITPVHFIHLALTDDRGELLSENFYWRSSSRYEGRHTVTGPCAAGFEPLNHMPAARLKATMKKKSSTVTRNSSFFTPHPSFTLTLTLHNTGSHIAFFTQLLLTDAAGEPIHGTLYADNFFSLLPGQRRTITITPPADTRPSQLIVRGWNVAEQQLNIK